MLSTVNGIDLLMLLGGMLIGLLMGVRVEMNHQETQQRKREKLRQQWLATGTPIAAELSHEMGRNVGPT